jgi:hypothetical protein
LGVSTETTGSFFFFEFDTEDFAVNGVAFTLFFLSSNDRMVGGSCIGSPAKMSFFALNIGIQHTYPDILATRISSSKQ